MNIALKLILSRFFFFSFLLVSLTSVALEGITLKDIDGKSYDLAQYKGKWVVVNYWATWCPPCLEEIPDLVNIYDQRKDSDLMMFGVVFDYKNEQEVRVYMDDMLMSYPVVLGNKDVVTKIGSSEVLPTTYIYDPHGRLIKVKKGLVSRHYLDTLLK
jgi:thiol-disulfide isomerase/thioredoxin